MLSIFKELRLSLLGPPGGYTGKGRNSEGFEHFEQNESHTEYFRATAHAWVRRPIRINIDQLNSEHVNGQPYRQDLSHKRNKGNDYYLTLSWQ